MLGSGGRRWRDHQETTMKYLNINDSVTVVLTTEGARIYNARPGAAELGLAQVGEGSVIRDQLWGLMEIFGPHITLGRQPPFQKCRIGIDEKELE